MSGARIEVFAEGQWAFAAEIDLRGGESVQDETWLDYDIDYAFDHLGRIDHRAVSCRFPVDYQQHDVPSFPAFTLDMMPQGEARRRLASELRERGIRPTDWAVLIHGARNPVGNLRIAEAVTSGPESDEGVDPAEVALRGEAFRDWAEEQGIPMTGSTDTGGAAPKLLMTEDALGKLHADGALPDERARHHWLIKFPRGRRARDEQVLANEAAYLEVARAMGLRCPAPSRYDAEGALFVPRFDRRARQRENQSSEVDRLGLESLYSLMGVSEAGASLMYEDACRALASVVDDAEADVLELVLRDVLSLALGDPDNHGRNTSVLKDTDGSVRLSPLYDFAPMYLDPEMIRRQTRWSKRLGDPPDWRSVATALAGVVSEERLTAALRSFGETLAEAPRIMRDLGVDEDIVLAREPSIRSVAKALSGVEL